MGEKREASKDVPREEGQVVFGVMKTWDVGKGFGFLTCDDGGSDLFVHQSVVQVNGDRYRAVAPGTAVQCEYYHRDGKETARTCSGRDGLLPGFASKLEAAQTLGGGSSSTPGPNTSAGYNPYPTATLNRHTPGGKLSGTVKWFNEAKGFGFIMPAEGAADIYFKGGDIGGHVLLKTDDQVTYEIVKAKDAEAKQWAVNVTKTQPMGRYTPYPPSPYGQPPSPYSFYPPQVAPEPPRSGQVSGTVKWYNEPKGFGFLVPANGGADIYFKGTDVLGSAGPLTTGEVVSWEIMTATDQEAKQWAINITRRGAYPQPDASRYAPPPSPYSAYPPRPLAPSHYPEPAYAPTHYEPYPTFPPDAHAAYAAYNDPNKYADPTAYGSAYPHQSAYAPSSVSYPPQAAYSSPDPYRPPTYPPYDPYQQQQAAAPALYDPNRPQGRLSGTVKWFNEQKAFGFLCPIGGSGDVYFRGTDVVLNGGPALKTDDVVLYDLVKANDQEGKTWAVNVSRATTAPSSGGGFKRKSSGSDVDGGAKRFVPLSRPAPRSGY